jgi:Transposase, Mutator family
VLERALAEEMTDHLGYEKHDPSGRGSGNSRNGTTGKTLLTDVGTVDLAAVAALAENGTSRAANQSPVWRGAEAVEVGADKPDEAGWSSWPGA